MAEDVLANAPNAGTLQSSTLFAVAQSTAGTKIQKMGRSAMVFTGELIGSEFGNNVKSMTPASFNDTNGNEVTPGTMYVASNTNIASKSTTKALVASKIDQIFQSGIKITGTVDNSDIDGSTQGVVNIIDVRGSTYGTFAKLVGSFTFKPNVSTRRAKIYINNVQLPIIPQAASASLTSDASPNDIHAVGVRVENEASKLLITIGRGTIDWATAETYTIWINLDFVTNI